MDGRLMARAAQPFSHFPRAAPATLLTPIRAPPDLRRPRRVGKASPLQLIGWKTDWQHVKDFWGSEIFGPDFPKEEKAERAVVLKKIPI